MTRIKPFKRWRIRSQIIASVLLLLLAVALGLSLTSYRLYKRDLEQNHIKTIRNNLQVLSDTLDLKLKVDINLVRELTASDEFLAIVHSPNVSGVTRYTGQMTSDLTIMWSGIENQDAYLDAVFLFDEKGRYFRRMAGNRSAADYMRFYQSDWHDEPWVAEVTAARGREVFFGGDLLSPDSGRRVLSYAKLLIDPNTSETVGMLVVNLRTTILSNSLFCNDANFRSDTLLLLDGDDCLYMDGDEHYAPGVLAEYQQGGSRCLFTETRSTVTGWTLVNGLEKRDLNRLSTYVGMVVAVTACGLMLTALLVVLLISRVIDRPLKQLRHVVDQVGSGQPIHESFDDGEIGQVGQVLSQTVNRNVELGQKLMTTELKEREAELMLLHAQINPHFLYNTLDTIYCRAIVDGDESIAEMVASLSQMFKLSLAKGRYDATIGEEIDYIRVYMELLQMRFGDKVSLSVDVPEALLTQRVIKFLLQPFVENAVYHGIEPSMDKGVVTLRGRMEGEDIYLEVEDDGVGMEDEEAVFSGYGVRNVVDRIHLTYGESYGITVVTAPEQGTRVTIHVPRMKEATHVHADAD